MAWIDIEMRIRLSSPNMKPDTLSRLAQCNQFLKSTCGSNIPSDSHHIEDMVDALELFCNVVRRARVSGAVGEESK